MSRNLAREVTQSTVIDEEQTSTTLTQKLDMLAKPSPISKDDTMTLHILHHVFVAWGCVDDRERNHKSTYLQGISVEAGLSCTRVVHRPG